MKRGDTFVVERYNGEGPFEVEALPMRYPTFGDAYEARETIADLGIPAVLALTDKEHQIAVFSPAPFVARFNKRARRFKRVPRGGARLRALAKKAR